MGFNSSSPHRTKECLGPGNIGWDTDVTSYKVPASGYGTEVSRFFYEVIAKAVIQTKATLSGPKQP